MTIYGHFSVHSIQFCLDIYGHFSIMIIYTFMFEYNMLV